MRRRIVIPVCTAALVTGAACGRVADVVELVFDQPTPRERYQARLEVAGLTTTAVGRDWLAAGERALREAPLIETPWREEGYLPPAEPAAVSFRLTLHRGQGIDFDLELAGDPSALVFVDVWEIESDTSMSFRQRATADSGSRSIHFEPRRDADYIVRAQPELLRGGRFTATLRAEPILSFPVEGGRDSDIGSVFGDPRDGGVRDHHGIDIFARRGTPALAAAPATVSRVEITPIGGKVVWLRDRRGNSLYYAHLDSQVVGRGRTLKPGDTVGFVGNTGNARTTPPHLHFGVYSRGPVNPYWFVHRPRGVVPRLVADTGLLGEWARIVRAGTTLHAAASPASTRVAELDRNTVVRIVGATGEWFRVRLPDGTGGYVAAGTAEPAGRGAGMAVVGNASRITTSPDRDAGIIADVSPGDSVTVLGNFGDYLLVRVTGAAEGWMPR
jgi:peptidoglycan LD-endopeptidase LytH